MNERVEVVRGWRTYSDGSQSPIERWVKHADGDWVSLDSSRRTSGDILMDFDAGVNAPDVPTAQPGSGAEGSDSAPVPASSPRCIDCGCFKDHHTAWGCEGCSCENVPKQWTGASGRLIGRPIPPAAGTRRVICTNCDADELGCTACGAHGTLAVTRVIPSEGTDQ